MEKTQKLLLLVALIFITGLILRIVFYTSGGFYEPDVYYHYEVVRTAIAIGHVPQYLSTSGYPSTIIPEPIGLYFTPLLLVAVGFSAITSIFITPLIFYVLEFLVAIIFIRLVWNDKRSLLVALLFAFIAVAAISRTAWSTYRGDGFVSLWILVAFISLYYSLKPKAWYLFAGASGASFALAELFWGGGQFGIFALLVAFALFLWFYKGKKINMWSFPVAYLVFAAISVILAGNGWILSSPLYGIFVSLIIFVGMSALTLVFYSGLKSKLPFYAACIIIMGVLIFVQSDLLQYVVVGNGFTPNTLLFSTISELQPPNQVTYMGTLGSLMFITPIGWGMMVGTLLPHSIPVVFAIWAILATTSLYFMRKYFKNPAVILLFGWFSVTLYLAMSAIRFTTLLVIPFGILSAFIVLKTFDEKKRDKKLRRYMFYYFGMLIFLLPVFTVVSIWNLAPADYINGNFINASVWLGSHTPGNSLIVSLWPDGSVIESVANRTVWMDTVGSLNATRTYAFARWVFSQSTNSSYLSSLPQNLPTYIFFRKVWQEESLAISIEGGYGGTYYIQDNYTPPGISGTVYAELLNCTSCSMGNYTLTLVFNNSDSRIYKISRG